MKQELSNNYLYYFGNKDKAELFVCFALKCERTNAFLIRLPKWFSMCFDSDRKILPLYYKHVIKMISRKMSGKSHQLVFSEVFFKAPKGNLALKRILFEVRPFLVALPYFADSCSKPLSWRVSVK